MKFLAQCLQQPIPVFNTQPSCLQVKLLFWKRHGRHNLSQVHQLCVPLSLRSMDFLQTCLHVLGTDLARVKSHYPPNIGEEVRP